MMHCFHLLLHVNQTASGTGAAASRTARDYRSSSRTQTLFRFYPSWAAHSLGSNSQHQISIGKPALSSAGFLAQMEAWLLEPCQSAHPISPLSQQSMEPFLAFTGKISCCLGSKNLFLTHPPFSKPFVTLSFWITHCWPGRELLQPERSTFIT